MKFNVVVTTHHKTGTVWMLSVFSAIAKAVGAGYIDFWSHYGRLDPLLRTPFILFNYDSTFRRHSNILAREDVRILHIIRDPRDVLISAMHYHKTADEAWLHQTVPGGDDVPYQRKLNSFATPFEQYLFEMENASSSTIEDMLDWRYDRPNCLEIRYEDLRVDHSMVLWSQILAFLGFDESEQKACKDCFWNYSLFGGAAGAKSRTRPVRRRRAMETGVHAQAGASLRPPVSRCPAGVGLRDRRPVDRAAQRGGPGRVERLAARAGLTFLRTRTHW